MATKYTVGVDFGTESGRAVLVDVATGEELATAVYPYSNGVIDRHLPPPDDDVLLEPDWALQDPEDYLRTFQVTVPSVLERSGVDPSDVVGIGVDFTACTMLPTTADGTPLCALAEWRRNPHAWVKLWKHHAAQPEADRINTLARERGEDWLPRYGGKISSEWFYSKALQILDEAPDLYVFADRLIEAADWVVWRLTGVETRNSCTAGYKAIWSKREGFPDADYFAGLDPRFANVVQEKMSSAVTPIGERAGGLTAEAAAWTGLVPGTAVAVANVDAHVSVPAATVTGPGRMVAVMGTSICHLALGATSAVV
ncbi:MAG: FGGY family carbohydrate kinase, partial [Actinomycetota bacterium]